MKIVRVGMHTLPLPARQTDGAAGYDLSSGCMSMGCVSDLCLYPGDRRLIGTGFAWQIPEGHVGLIRPRSGLANKHGIDVMAGVIDSDYTGEVKVLLVNHGNEDVVVNHGDRIAQMLVVACRSDELIEVPSFDSITERGANGFGSTGSGHVLVTGDIVRAGQYVMTALGSADNQGMVLCRGTDGKTHRVHAAGLTLVQPA